MHISIRGAEAWKRGAAGAETCFVIEPEPGEESS